MLYGFAGTVLRVDLSTGEIRKEPLDPALAREWLGGRGFVAKVLYDEVPRDADPLGPENRLVVCAGALTGHMVPAGSKAEFGAISPATNGHGDSNMGGHFGPELRYAGYDMIVFRGVAPEPVYLFIEDERVELRPATELWGKGAMSAERALHDALGEDFQVATIGPAGENQVAYACISHFYGRQAGRTGIGAVMGSKRLKAIAVRGHRGIPLKDPKALVRQTQAVVRRTLDHPLLAPWAKYGTAMFVGWSNKQGTLPTRNFQSSAFESAAAIDGEPFRDKLVIADRACNGCWMRCGKAAEVKLPGRPAVRLEGPEYETSALMGSNLGLSTIEEVAYANYLADEMGLDTISAGATVAFALECVQRGILSAEQLGATQLGWGDLDSVQHLLELITRREGLGDLLALGTRKAAASLGAAAQAITMEAKGLEFSGYETRWAPSQLLSYCTSDIGAHHNRSWAITVDIATGRETYTGKAQTVIYLQHLRPLFDSLCICRLQWGEIDVLPEEYAESLRHVTGWDIDLDEMLRISEKTWNLVRAHYLLRNGGPGRLHDRAPLRAVSEPIPDGPAKGHFIPPEGFETMLDEYYEHRGWDPQGLPSGALLHDLGLAGAARELEDAGLLGADPPGGLPAVRGREFKPEAM